MSDLNDPRVLFAAERTLLAWSRTAAGLMAFGFLIDRSGDFAIGGTGKSPQLIWVSLVLIVFGVALCALSIIHYERAVATLRPVEIPPKYWVHFSTYATVGIGMVGVVLAVLLFT